jgi:hypothetical protein
MRCTAPIEAGLLLESVREDPDGSADPQELVIRSIAMRAGSTRGAPTIAQLGTHSFTVS